MLTSVEYRLPLPLPNPDDREFWEGCKRHELMIQQCVDCGTLRFWGQPMCSTCNAVEGRAVKASGRGVIWSFTTTHHPFGPIWKDAVPYTIVVVQLDEGPRMVSNLVGAAEDEIQIGQPVETFFDDVTPDVTLAKFRPM
jgi:uncharacterized OB-fold protein